MTRTIRKKIQTLTPREREVLQVLCEGANNELIAARLGIARNTVKNHLKNCMFKLGVGDRWELIIQAWKYGVTPWPKELVRAVKSQQTRQPRGKRTRKAGAFQAFPVRV